MKVKNYFIHLWNNHQLRHMLIVAVTLMLILANGESKPPDWQNFIGVVILVVFNSILSFQLVDSTNQVGHLQDVSTLIAIFCIGLEVGAIMLMISIMYPIQHKRYRQGIEDLIFIFMGGFVITMPNMLFVIMAMGMNWLSEQGAIIKSYTSIEDIARMDIPCTDMTGTLTSSDLKVLKTFIKVFGDEVEEDDVLPKAARASRIGIAVLGETDAARSAADIILTVPDLTVPDLNVIFKVVLSSRVILQRMKSYAIYAVAITTFLVPGFMLLVLIWGFSFPPFLVLIIAIISNVTIVLIAKDMVNPSPLPDSLKFAEIFATGIILGSYLATTTIIFFWATYKTSFFPWIFRVPTLEKTALDHDDIQKLVSAIYLQVSIISQALIFVTRSRSWSYVERRPGLCHVVVFVVTGLGATLFAVYANGSFAAIEGIGWGWAGVIWLYNIILYITLDFIKFFVRYALTWWVWDPVKIAIISLIDFLNDDPELQSTG